MEVLQQLKEARITIPEEIEKEFTFIRFLGRGSFSTVYLVENKETKTQDALKIIDKKKVPRKDRLEAEIEALLKCKHKYIIELKRTWENEKNLFILTEYADGGEVYEKLVKRGVYSEYFAAVLFKKILEAVDFLHRDKDIIHRDLKPENILLVGDSDLEPRINDFGISKLFDQNHLRPGQEGYKRKIAYSHVGSTGYTAPEILEAKGYDHSVDMWSLGIILYNLISGGSPFSQENMQEQHEQITNPNRETPFPGPWKFVSRDVRDLISSLLDYNPLNRPSANEALQHPWVQDPETCIKAHQKYLEALEKGEDPTKEPIEVEAPIQKVNKNKKEKQAFNQILKQIVSKKSRKKPEKQASIKKLNVSSTKKAETKKSDSNDKKVLQNWSVDDVCNWMNSLNLTQDYSETVKKNGIDGEVLLDMEKEDWNEMGITAIGDVKKLLKHRNSLKN